MTDLTIKIPYIQDYSAFMYNKDTEPDMAELEYSLRNNSDFDTIVSFLNVYIARIFFRAAQRFEYIDVS